MRPARGGRRFRGRVLARRRSNGMLPKFCKCGAALACGIAVLLSVASAGDKKGDKSALAGTWSKKGAELKIEFADKGVLKILPHGDPALIAIVCDYSAGKGGLVK